MTTAPSRGPASGLRTGPRYAIYALALLSLINVVNYAERNAIFALFEPIKAELSLSDTHLGWLGSAYVLVFSLAALPVGVLSDLRGRTGMIAGGVAIWSAFTSLGGLARGFVTLLISRAAVGMGGAAANAASTSVIADFYPGARRALAMAIFTAGLVLGGVAGLVIAGQLEHEYGWRVALLAMGVPGFGLAALAARLRDPMRGSGGPPIRAYLRQWGLDLGGVVLNSMPLVIGLAAGAIAAYALDRQYGADSALDVAAFATAAVCGLILNLPRWFRSASRRVAGSDPGVPTSEPAPDDLLLGFTTVLRTPTLIYVFIGGALLSFGLNGTVAWAPSYFFRALGLSISESTLLLGKWGLLAGIAGTVTGGLLADGLRKRMPTARIVTGAGGFLIGCLLAVWFLTIRRLDLVVPVFVASFFFLSMHNGPLTAVIFDVVPARIGTTVIGAYLLFIHVAGDAIALPLVGKLSDTFGLERAIFLLPAAGFLGALIILAGARTLIADQRRVQAGGGG